MSAVDNWYEERFTLYGALWKACSEFHSGMSSRGYRILSRLSKADYNPGLALQQGILESEEQADIYFKLVARSDDL